MSNEHLPVLVVVFPLAAALLSVFLGKIWRPLARWVVLAGLLGSFLSAVVGLKISLIIGKLPYRLGGWAPPIGIEYVLDPLSGGMATLVGGLSFIVCIYAGHWVRKELSANEVYIYALYALLTSGLQGMVMTGDLFNLYVHLEVTALSVYALVAAGGDRASLAAFRYLILGTLGGTFYLLGVGFLYAASGTLNMADLATLLPEMAPRAVVVAVAFILTGLGIKMALFPMHGWMPDAYTYGPPGLVPFIAGAIGKVSAYAIIRVLYFVVKGVGWLPNVLQVLGILAAVAIVAGSIMAVAQRDIRRMLAYSSISQIGYIVLGISLGNKAGLIGATLHMLNHAVMKACLFFVVGSLAYRVGSARLEDFQDVARKMPLTMAAFSVAALSMIGLPPTAGFFSKLYLIQACITAGQWPYLVVIAASSLMATVYFFRILEQAYLQKQTAGPVSGWFKKEAPLGMLVPTVAMGVAILVLGFYSERIVSEVLLKALPGGM